MKILLGVTILLVTIMVFAGFFFYSCNEGKPTAKTENTIEQKTLKEEQKPTHTAENKTEVNKKGATQPFLLNDKAGSSMVINRSTKDAALTYDEQIEQSLFSGSALLIKNGSVVLASSYGYSDFSTGKFNRIDSEYYLTSIQKVITATLIMKLVEDKKIALDDTIDKYFHEEIQHKSEITIDDLLSMTSGLSLEKTAVDFANSDAYFDYVCSHLEYGKPAKWKYGGVNYTLLTMIIERVTSKSYEDVVSEDILAKSSFPHTKFSTSRDSNPLLSHGYSKADRTKAVDVKYANLLKEKGTGNMSMDTLDLYHFYSELISGRFISKEMLSQMWQMKTQPYTYDYKGGVYHKGNGVLYGHGFLGQYEPTMYLSADAQTCVILMSNSKDKPTYAPLAKSLFESLSDSFR